jgi:hypothetical protein
MKQRFVNNPESILTFITDKIVASYSILTDSIEQSPC